jgi:hypothetical protein
VIKPPASPGLTLRPGRYGNSLHVWASRSNLSKHRSVINAFVHIIAAITAYQINPFQPKRTLQPRYRLQTTA